MSAAAHAAGGAAARCGRDRRPARRRRSPPRARRCRAGRRQHRRDRPACGGPVACASRRSAAELRARGPADAARAGDDRVRARRPAHVDADSHAKRLVIDWLAQDFEPGPLQRADGEPDPRQAPSRHGDAAPSPRRRRLPHPRGRHLLAIGRLDGRFVTHYERLGVRPTATATEIRDAYRVAARSAHPDRHGDASSVRMASINESYRVLRDPDRRRGYDRRST